MVLGVGDTWGAGLQALGESDVAPPRRPAGGPVPAQMPPCVLSTGPSRSTTRSTYGSVGPQRGCPNWRTICGELGARICGLSSSLETVIEPSVCPVLGFGGGYEFPREVGGLGFQIFGFSVWKHLTEWWGGVGVGGR